MRHGNDLLRLLVPVLILIFLSVPPGNWRTVLAQVTPEKESIKKPGEKIETSPARETSRQFIPGSANSISEKNIFSPERKDFPLLGAGGTKPIVRPKIVLYGVTIAGDYQAASVVNPGRPLRKGERETITLRMGEQIAGYKLAKVSSDRITMEAEGDSFEVLLYDAREAKKRVEAKTDNSPTAVTNPFVVPAQAPTPSTPTVAEKPAVAPQQRVSIPAPTPSPTTPLIPPVYRPGRRTFYPRGTPAIQGTPATQEGPVPAEPGVPASTQGTGGNN